MKIEQDPGLPLNSRMPWPNGHRAGLHILVVEDDRDTAHSTAFLLRYDGHRVEVAADGLSAYHAARREPPDVILLDLALPGMNGWDVARRLQEPTWDKRPLVIALTGYGGEAERRHSREAGIDLHLVKPVDPDVLRRVLARFYRIIRPTEVWLEEEGEPQPRPPRNTEPCEDTDLAPLCSSNEKARTTMRSKTTTLTNPAPTTATSERQPAAAPASGGPAEKGKPVSVGAIRLRAYQKWESAGKPAGDGVRFWLEAEQELQQTK